MGTKTFTEKLIDLLVTGDMPKAKGKAATETGLVIALSGMTSPVCASYGSSKEMSLAIYNIIKLSDSIRKVMAVPILAYYLEHQEDYIIKQFIESLNHG